MATATTPLFNAKVLMSDADNFSIEVPINPYYHKESLDLEKARAEHDQLVSLYQQAGIEVVRVPSPTGSQDGVYTANWALVRGGKAVMARLPGPRKPEEAHARAELEKLGIETVLVPGNLHFSGQGDTLACGEYLFCGTGYRSEPESVKFAAEALGFTPVILRALPELDSDGEPMINDRTGWPDSFFYDIDLAVAVIEPPHDEFPGLIAYCRDALDEPSQAAIEATPMQKIIIDYNEAVNGFAANLISTGRTVIMSAHAPKLQAELESRGYRILSPEVTEIVKGGGFIRCTSLSLG